MPLKESGVAIGLHVGMVFHFKIRNLSCVIFENGKLHHLNYF